MIQFVIPLPAEHERDLLCGKTQVEYYALVAALAALQETEAAFLDTALYANPYRRSRAGRCRTPSCCVLPAGRRLAIRPRSAATANSFSVRTAGALPARTRSGTCT